MTRVYVRSVGASYAIDPETASHEFLVRFRFVSNPPQDPNAVIVKLEDGAKGLLRDAVASNLEFLAWPMEPPRVVAYDWRRQ